MKTQITPRTLFLHIFMPAFLCLSILLIASGCFAVQSNNDTGTSTSSSANDTLLSSAEVNDTANDTTDTIAPETTASETAPETTAVSAPETTAVSETETTASETAPDPTTLTDSNAIEIYSSPAYMVSFDPSTGLAEFDYVDYLTGQAAIDWLVEHEGYTQADAEAKVNNFADTEYVEKNINPQLRTIDMTTVPITTNLDENGYLALPQVPLTYGEFVNRIDEFLCTPSNYPVSEIIVKDGEIVEVNVEVFLG